MCVKSVVLHISRLRSQPCCAIPPLLRPGMKSVRVVMVVSETDNDIHARSDHESNSKMNIFVCSLYGKMYSQHETGVKIETSTTSARLNRMCEQTEIDVNIELVRTASRKLVSAPVVRQVCPVQTAN